MLLVHERSPLTFTGSAALQPIERRAMLAARGDANVLITGERGPAKAALARFIHEESDRGSQAFAILKCDRLSDELVRSELFGHVESAGAGAYPEMPGLLASDFCGTVFLDEIGALGAATQARLLRFLESDDVHRPVRVICSTSINLEAQVLAGMFQLDLYDRLSEVTLALG